MLDNEGVKDLIKELENKEVNKIKLTECELAILDAHKAQKKQGKELTARAVEQIKFMMD